VGEERKGRGGGRDNQKKPKTVTAVYSGFDICSCPFYSDVREFFELC
jgi:hypothetical protein